MTARLLRRATLASAAILSLSAAQAFAVDAVTPAPCNGLHLEDASGDAMLTPQGGFGLPVEQPGTKKGPDEADITGVFFNFRAGKDGKKVLTANIRVAKLSKDVPAPPDSSGGLAWYVIFTYKGAIRFVRAQNQTGDSVTYAYGTIDPDLGTYTTDGETKGAFFEGPNGIVQLDVPEELGGKPGEELGGALATVDAFSGGPDDASGINNNVDSAPDGATPTKPNGKAYTVTECPAEAPKAAPDPVPASPAPVSSPDTPPASTGSGSGSGSGAGSGTSSGSSASSRPVVAFSKVIGSARKARKGRTLRVKVRSTRAITKLTVRLRDARGRVVARGKLRRLDGLGTLKLKIARSLKVGRYTARASALVDGRRQTVSQAVFAKR